MFLDGVPRPDHGPGFRQRVCATCHAGWVGHQRDGDDWCPWCETALERQRADQRRLLLDPPWLRQGNGQRYDDLTEAAKGVWDRTRGQARGLHSVEAWVERLARAVEAGVIDEADARTAIKRVKG